MKVLLTTVLSVLFASSAFGQWEGKYSVTLPLKKTNGVFIELDRQGQLDRTTKIRGTIRKQGKKFLFTSNSGNRVVMNKTNHKDQISGKSSAYFYDPDAGDCLYDSYLVITGKPPKPVLIGNLQSIWCEGQLFGYADYQAWASFRK